MKFKKLRVLFLLSTSLLSVAHAAGSNWVQAGATPDGARYLIDLNNVTVAGEKTWFWTKMADAPTKDYDVVLAKNYVDCAHRDQAIITSQRFYDKNGNDLGTSQKARTIEVENGSPMASFVKGACTVSEALHPTAKPDNPVPASEFRRLDLAYGISIEIPSHWVVLDQATRENLGAAGTAIMTNAGIEDSGGKKDRLLSVNATPYPTGSMVRVSVTTPADYSQDDLAAATSADFKGVEEEMRRGYAQAEGSGMPKLLEMQRVHTENFNGRLALVVPYIRADRFGPSPWQVTMYKIPVSGRLVEITLSQRQSDAPVWQPILERVKRSVRF